MEEKYVLIGFNCGDTYKVPALYVAEKIVERLNPEKKISEEELKKQVRELMEDEIEFLGQIWDIPWRVLKEKAVIVRGTDIEDEWNNGLATISSNL